jgi:hypothetical protein
MIQVIVRIVAASVVSDPFVVRVDVRGLGMSRLVSRKTATLL